MSEQKQFGQLVGMVIQNMPDMTSKQMQRWIIDPIGLQEFLLGLLIGKEASVFLVGTTKQVVNYDCSIVDLLKAGKYDCSNDDLTDANFPSKEKGECEVEFGLFYFGKGMSSDDAIVEMKILYGFRPATIKELLAYGEKNFVAQCEFPIVALASTVLLCNSRYVGGLNNDSSGRGAHLGYGDGIWNRNCRFLGVRI